MQASGGGLRYLPHLAKNERDVGYPVIGDRERAEKVASGTAGLTGDSLGVGFPGLLHGLFVHGGVLQSRPRKIFYG